MKLSMQDQVLIENKLIPATLTFYELPDGEKAELFIREFFTKYCEERNLDKKAVYLFMRQRLKEMSEFNKNVDPKLAVKLRSMVLTESERKNQKRTRKSTARGENDDDDVR